MEIINTFQQLNRHEKKALLINTLRNIAVETADDILPLSVIEEIKRMIELGLVDDYATVLKDIVKGKFDFKRTVDVATKSVPFCFYLCGKKSS